MKKKRQTLKLWTDGLMVWFKFPNKPLIAVFSDGYTAISSNTEEEIETFEDKATLKYIQQTFPAAFEKIMAYERGELKVV